jgi:diguanylate cyclase (GGDEF)-like protein
MKDPRVVEIEFLSALERERPSTIAPWDWEKRLGISGEAFRDMVFDLFRSCCLDGASALIPPSHTLNAPPEEVLGSWGAYDLQRNVRSALKRESFAAYVNHAGRLRLFRLQDEIAGGRIKDAFGLLWDQRHWDTDLIVRLAMKAPEKTAVVLFIDVDDFKTVNTKAGYLVGNEVLRIVFQIVLSRATGIGEAYRWGGDEIALLLPDAALEVGERIGEVIRAEVERECGAHPALQAAGVKTTVSVGVGAFAGRPLPAAVTTAVSELMKTKVKTAGKNKVVAEALVL